jgi:hypothetical protein
MFSKMLFVTVGDRRDRRSRDQNRSIDRSAKLNYRLQSWASIFVLSEIFMLTC